MIEDNRQNVVGVVPTNTAERIPTRLIENEYTQKFNGNDNITVTSTVHAVPSGKINKITYINLYNDSSASSHFHFNILNSDNSLKATVIGVRTQGSTSPYVIHSFTEPLILENQEQLQILIVSGSPEVDWHMIYWEN